MRTMPAGLDAAVQERATALARLCVITRRDGGVVRFTTAPDLIVHDGQVYEPAVAVSMSAIRNRSDFGSASCTLEAASAPGATLDTDDLIAGRFDAAAITIHAVDALDATSGSALLFAGTLGTATLTDTGRVTVEMRGPLDRGRSLDVQKYTPHCRTDLGNPARCKVNLADHTWIGSVTAVVSEFEIEVALTTAAPDDGWFAWGALQWTSGSNTGLMAEVRGWTKATNRVTLMMPAMGIVEEGDSFTITAGCDKRLSTCDTKFANQLNFRGEPHVPVIAGRAVEGGGGGGEGGGTTDGQGWITPTTPVWSFRVTCDMNLLNPSGGASAGMAWTGSPENLTPASSNWAKTGTKPISSLVSPVQVYNLGPTYTWPFGLRIDDAFTTLKDPVLGFIPPPSLSFAGINFVRARAALGEVSSDGNLFTVAYHDFEAPLPSSIVPITGSRPTLWPGSRYVYSLTMYAAENFSPVVFTVPGMGWALAWNL